MKTTLDLPDDLMRAVKIRAAEENRKLKDLIADLLRIGLASNHSAAGQHAHRVALPLVECARPAAADEEITPDRAADILLEQEAASVAVR